MFSSDCGDNFTFSLTCLVASYMAQLPQCLFFSLLPLLSSLVFLLAPQKLRSTASIFAMEHDFEEWSQVLFRSVEY